MRQTYHTSITAESRCARKLSRAPLFVNTARAHCGHRELFSNDHYIALIVHLPNHRSFSPRAPSLNRRRPQSLTVASRGLYRRNFRPQPPSDGKARKLRGRTRAEVAVSASRSCRSGRRLPHPRRSFEFRSRRCMATLPALRMRLRKAR